MKSLAWHGRSYLAVGTSIATTCAVICGALLVGDSVRESLRIQALERLGRTEYSLDSPKFFREELAGSLAPKLEAIPMVLLRGSVVHSENRRRASGVNIIGIDGRFEKVARSRRSWSLGLRETRINATLATELDAKSGDELLVSFELHSDIPREHARGRREDAIQRLKVSVLEVEADSGTALFDLRLQQETPRNVFVSLERLQKALDRPGEVNAIVVCSGGTGEPRGALRARWKLEDIGALLRVDAARGYISLESRDFLLDSRLVAAAREATARSPYQRQEVLTYLANAIEVGGAEIPYSLVSAASPWLLPGGGEAAGPLDTDGVSPTRAFRKGDIVLNSWAMKDLKASIGDRVRLRYFVIGPDHGMVEKTSDFELLGSVELAGAALDPGWTPEYPGVSDAGTFSDWDPPFAIDHSKIREPGPDGDYWKEYRTTPKAFLGSADGQRLWAGKYGQLTSLRIKIPAGAAAEVVRDDFSTRLRASIDPENFGLGFREIRREAVEASRSGTDFGMLFISMSFFIIAAGLMLTSMTLRLALERRSRSLGMLGALGFSRGRLRGLLAREGLLATLLGSLVGLLGGVGYAALLIEGLKTWWRDAVNTPFLALHVSSQSLGISLVATLALVAVTGAFVIGRLASLRPRRLLSGESSRQLGREDIARSGRRRLVLGILLVGLAACLCAAAFFEFLPAVPAFLSIGGALLAAGLVLFSWGLRAAPPGKMTRSGVAGLIGLGLRNGRRAGGRSLLTAGLIACATFVVVTVAAFQRDPVGDQPDKGSGNGGFAMVGRSSSPLYPRLDTEAGRIELGLDDAVSKTLAAPGTGIYAMRERPGDETSCLNLYRPSEPRILGAPGDFIERGGFSWGGSLAEDLDEKENPWILLEKDWEGWDEGVIPAIGDQNTVKWILHSGLGKDIRVRDGKGRDVSLRIVGLLSNSLLQGSLVVSSRAFEDLFPAMRGWSTFFVESSPGDREPLRESLEAQLVDFGLDLRSSGEILAHFNRVQNTYLSTFMVLGGLGLLLGTVGLGSILLRNVNERRGELALMRALGFSNGALSIVVLTETLFLIIFGEIQGAAAALVATAPGLASAQSEMAWGPLALILVLVLAGGLLSCSLALRAALRVPVLGALRAE